MSQGIYQIYGLQQTWAERPKFLITLPLVPIFFFAVDDINFVPIRIPRHFVYYFWFNILKQFHVQMFLGMWDLFILSFTHCITCINFNREIIHINMYFLFCSYFAENASLPSASMCSGVGKLLFSTLMTEQSSSLIPEFLSSFVLASQWHHNDLQHQFHLPCVKT